MKNKFLKSRKLPVPIEELPPGFYWVWDTFGSLNGWVVVEKRGDEPNGVFGCACGGDDPVYGSGLKYFFGWVPIPNPDDDPNRPEPAAVPRLESWVFSHPKATPSTAPELLVPSLFGKVDGKNTVIHCCDINELRQDVMTLKDGRRITLGEPYLDYEKRYNNARDRVLAMIRRGLDARVGK